jgi:ABC-2 type transport system ATP-binding protein
MMSSISLDNAPAGTTSATPRANPAIVVEDLHKSFRIPTHRVDSLKERIVHPFAGREHRDLHALDGVSFEIRQGEFFGIVGRNGSGKSTLLKLLASIYRADSGRIRIAGRLAPFIELGVGFNMDLTARENVLLNGVMMGLTPKEVRDRQDAVIDFAELHDFADLKLKNYSSGMLVRLAFSVMLEADADVLLIDEVLAVGDASFQQKCADAFHAMKEEGKTIILVTHEMNAVEEYCHRALLLADGKVKFIGDPAAAGREYMKLNFEAAGTSPTGAEEVGSDGARLLDCRLEDEAGAEVANIESGVDIRLATEVELLRETASAVHVGYVVTNADGLGVFEFGEVMNPEDQAQIEPFPVGQRFRLRARVENRLAPGRYFVHIGVTSAGGISAYAENAASFIVFGGHKTNGLINPKLSFEVDAERGER